MPSLEWPAAVTKSLNNAHCSLHLPFRRNTFRSRRDPLLCCRSTVLLALGSEIHDGAQTKRWFSRLIARAPALKKLTMPMTWDVHIRSCRVSRGILPMMMCPAPCLRGEWPTATAHPLDWHKRNLSAGGGRERPRMSTDSPGSRNPLSALPQIPPGASPQS